MLRTVKRLYGLDMPGIYRIPCDSNSCYIGQMGCSIMECCKEHQQYMLDQQHKSPLVEHCAVT